MTKIKTIEDLKDVTRERYILMSEVSPSYLNDAGKAAIKAYMDIYWHASFHDTIESLVSDEDFKALIREPNQHSEYYKILRMCYRHLEKFNTEEEGI